MSACSAAGWGAYLSLYFQMAKVERSETVWKIAGGF